MALIKYPPYLNAYGILPKLFAEIKKASVPAKVTRDFLGTVLGLASSSYHAAIPLLKKLGFIDNNNVPTEMYKQFRDDEYSGTVMAKSIRESYPEIFATNEYAYKLSREDLLPKVRTVTGGGEEDKVIPAVVGTFLELCKLAKFEDGKIQTHKEKPKIVDSTSTEGKMLAHEDPLRLGISYTINLNLPATTEIEVFNAIFKSLREHILHGK